MHCQNKMNVVISQCVMLMMLGIIWFWGHVQLLHDRFPKIFYIRGEQAIEYMYIPYFSLERCLAHSQTLYLAETFACRRIRGVLFLASIFHPGAAETVEKW